LPNRWRAHFKKRVHLRDRNDGSSAHF
jgi:hypothetical protein